ncbi:TrmH family RNA methyltransferase [Leptolinea tardivitalis]|uniref:RNA 2-O ribose methyltransferase substrate binding domain-containing protein n=1 Tax=Leptolinea tardivitalis TaxID=229920 RepID=A0A0P6XLB9_9CHLR|nr:RNA methyltransferase [Leptolinea tardivitalis]KPL72532.1 hypothetical protein ADM99_05245 [Leptolinea tardivitalis]GAP21174.1 rRNA methylase [Leptolinea tardivitalis]
MITSKKNPRIQLIRSLLQDRKSREETHLYIIEGVRLVEEAYAKSVDISDIFYCDSLSDRGKSLLDQFSHQNIPVEKVDEDVFLSIMDTATSQGIAAICRYSKPTLPSNLDFLVLADQLRDPGNLGTLLRTAAAAGAQAVITTHGSVDLYSPKVLRSAMGAHFHMVCMEMDWPQIMEEITPGTANGLTSYVAAADGKATCWECDFTKPTLLIVGSEANGASQQAFQFADCPVSIPMPGGFESLNAAVAAGILLFEVVRQRNSPIKKEIK